MITVQGTLKYLTDRADEFGDAYLRVYLEEQARPGLADDVRELLPNAVEVKVQAAQAAGSALATREGLQPRDLLLSYFEQANVRDESVIELFDALVEKDHETASP
jgi:exonuclease SbcD